MGHDWSLIGFPTHSSNTLFVRHILGEQNLEGLCLEWWLQDPVWSVTLTSLGNAKINDGVLDVCPVHHLKSRMRVFGRKGGRIAGMCSSSLELCSWWVWQGSIIQSIDKVSWFWQGVKQRSNTRPLWREYCNLPEEHLQQQEPIYRSLSLFTGKRDLSTRQG